MVHNNPVRRGVFAYKDWTWFWARGPDSDVDPHRGNTPDKVHSCYNHNQTDEVYGEHNGKTDPLMVGVMFGFARLPGQTQRNTGGASSDHVSAVHISRTRVSTGT